MTVLDHDFGPAVDSLVAIHNGEPGRPPLHWPAPIQPGTSGTPRPLVPVAPHAARPIPPIRAAAPAPKVQRRTTRLDLRRVGRRARAMAALARINCCRGCS